MLVHFPLTWLWINHIAPLSATNWSTFKLVVWEVGTELHPPPTFWTECRAGNSSVCALEMDVLVLDASAKLSVRVWIYSRFRVRVCIWGNICVNCSVLSILKVSKYFCATTELLFVYVYNAISMCLRKFGFFDFSVNFGIRNIQKY